MARRSNTVNQKNMRSDRGARSNAGCVFSGRSQLQTRAASSDTGGLE